MQKIESGASYVPLTAVHADDVDQTAIWAAHSRPEWMMWLAVGRPVRLVQPVKIRHGRRAVVAPTGATVTLVVRGTPYNPSIVQID